MKRLSLTTLGVAASLWLGIGAMGPASAAPAAPEAVQALADQQPNVTEARWCGGGGRGMCWRPAGWHGPGWYRCAPRRHGGWVGGWGWRHHHHGRGHRHGWGRHWGHGHNGWVRHHGHGGHRHGHRR